MPIFVSHEGICGDIFNYIARVERLAADLDVMAQGELPYEQDLSSAPFVDAWSVALRPVPRLVGICGNHRRLNGPVVTTTDSWVFSPNLGWARTLSRFYRLGTPRPEGAGH